MCKKECRLLLTSLGIVICSLSAFSQQKSSWQLQRGTMVTRWAKEVNLSNVLPEYPRPQLVRDHWINLNGLWNYVITPKDANTPAAYTGSILVPYPIESALSGVKIRLQPEQILWYKRTIAKPVTKTGERVLLHFGAVDFDATVYINGDEVGSHKGGYQNFSFDVTDRLKKSRNELVVKVWDPSDQGPNPHGKQVLNPQGIMYTPSSGIWQTVWLETVPAEYISGITITPDVDKSLVNIKVIADVDATVKLEAAGKVISGQANSTITVPVDYPKLWSPDAPYLYDLKITLGQDVVKSYFGMRKIEIKKDRKGIDRIFLNNTYTYNLGTLDQGFWPDGLYTAPTDAALKFDIEAAKAMGFNTIRKHIKIEPDRWYYHADKIGMLVWQDMVSPGNDTEEGRAQFEKENRDNITQLYNHPSIVTWVLFNEKWGQYDQERLTKWIKVYDPTRLVNGHSGEMLYVNDQLRSPAPNAWIGADMTDVHSYPFPRNAPTMPGKVRVLGEFGGIGVPIEGHLWDDLVAGWGYDGVVTPAKMQKQYTAMVDSLKVLERLGLSASIYTQPFDVESEQNGLMTYDRDIIKLPVVTLRRINSKVWPATKNCLAATKGFKATVADTITKSYAARMQEYRKGRNDSTFIRRLALMALVAKDTATASISSAQFITHLKDTFQESNLRFIQKFILATNDAGFNTFFKNTDKINRILGEDEAEAKLTFIIEKDEILPFISNQKEIDWQEIEKRLTDKYGNLGQEIALQRKVLHSINHQDWETFGSSFFMWFNKYGYKRKWITLAMVNDMAWATFLSTNNKIALESARKVTEILLQRDQRGGLLDTYANLLYKLGDVDEAITWQQKAVDADPGNADIKDNYEKMKKGQATWPINNMIN